MCIRDRPWRVENVGQHTPFGIRFRKAVTPARHNEQIRQACPFIGSVDAVSYTHLDVYKRQGQDNRSNRLHINVALSRSNRKLRRTRHGHLAHLRCCCSDTLVDGLLHENGVVASRRHGQKGLNRAAEGSKDALDAPLRLNHRKALIVDRSCQAFITVSYTHPDVYKRQAEYSL